jgi:quercetin dioxygenase-like cupin family protein
MRHIKLCDISPEPVSHDPELKKQVLLRQLGLLQGLSRALLGEGSEASEHAHPGAYEVLYLIRGRVEFTVEGRTLMLGPQELLVLEPGERHSLRVLQEAEFLYFKLPA